jgi:hypothetical protein
LSGSTRNCQTVSGVAAITISRSTEVVSVVVSMLRPLLAFRLAFECFEPVIPELLEQRLERGKPLRSRAIEALGALPAYGDEPRLSQHLQMLGDGLLADVEVRAFGKS